MLKKAPRLIPTISPVLRVELDESAGSAFTVMLGSPEEDANVTREACDEDDEGFCEVTDVSKVVGMGFNEDEVPVDG